METYIKDLIHLPEQVNRGDFVLRLTEDRGGTGVQAATGSLDRTGRHVSGGFP